MRVVHAIGVKGVAGKPGKQALRALRYREKSGWQAKAPALQIQGRPAMLKFSASSRFREGEA
jgi:hypothetical protein